MINRLIEFVLPRIIGIMLHKTERMTTKESMAYESFVSKLPFNEEEKKDPIIIAMIGLIGSGKSSVARELAPLIGATVIGADAIRVELRKQNERYEGARKIAEQVTVHEVKAGINVVLDSDHVDPKKRASIREKARVAGARIVFVRTYCDYDIAVGRILKEKFANSDEDFFGGATSQWGGKNRGAIVKMREMWRRTPHHYSWDKEGGGKWVLKKLPFKTMDVDTSSSDWREELRQILKGLT